MKQLAESIENMKPGTKILISGVEYIRMDDHPSHYVYDCVLDPKTGLWGDWLCSTKKLR